MGKHLFASRTFWVNIFALAASVLAGYGIDLGVEEQGALATAALAIVNIVLRLVTSEPVNVVGK